MGKEKSCHILHYADFGSVILVTYNCFLLGSVTHHDIYWLVTTSLLMSLENM
jgi:hypothetical protein